MIYYGLLIIKFKFIIRVKWLITSFKFDFGTFIQLLVFVIFKPFAEVLLSELSSFMQYHEIYRKYKKVYVPIKL